MPANEFDDARLAQIYDPLDPDRSDLDTYIAMIEEYGARSVLDVGCGTGALATMLAARGVQVTAVDPAGAMIEVARTKLHAERVDWIVGRVVDLPLPPVDLAIMTGNVAQVFVDDVEWQTTLTAIREALRPGGRLVFETRDPRREAWRRWTPELTRVVQQVDGVGRVEAWCEVRDATLPLISFCWTYRFPDGDVLTADSTLVFRDREQLDASVAAAGFEVADVREAPDRPGREWVYVARRR